MGNVPFLHAPGFIQAYGRGPFPDVSSCGALKITLRAAGEYAGYRVGFGMKKPPHSFPYTHGFKTKLVIPASSSSSDEPSPFVDVVVPFHEFSDKWDAATGDVTVPCSEENILFCPDAETLKNMKEVSVWGEGVAGSVNLEIKSISATGCGRGGEGGGVGYSDWVAASRRRSKKVDYEQIDVKVDEQAAKVEIV